MVKQRANLILLVLLLVLFAGWWGLALLRSEIRTPEAKTKTPFVSKVVQEPVIVHAHTSAAHTVYSGTLAAAAGCVELGTGVSVAGVTEPHVILQFFVTPQTCAGHATSTDNSFSVSVQGAAVLDQVLVNNSSVGYRVERDTQ